MTEPQQIRGTRVPGVILAGASVRSLAESALLSGMEPLCIDMFGDADLRRLLQRHRIPWSARRIPSLTVLPRVLHDIAEGVPLIWSGGLENHPEILRQLSRLMCVCGAPVETISRIRHPDSVARIVKPSGCRVPEIRPVPLLSRRMQVTSGDWVMKRRDSSGGVGVTRYEPGSRTSAPAQYLQRRVSGIPISATFVAGPLGCRFAGAALQLVGTAELGASEYLFCGNAGPVELARAAEMKISAAGELIAENGMIGVFGIDFVLDRDQVWLIEVNPRITASHELFDSGSPGPPLLLQQLEMFGDSILRREASSSRHSGSHMVRHEAPILLRFVVWSRRAGSLSHSDVATLLDLTREAVTKDQAGGGNLAACWVADVPNPGPISEGQPFCSIYRSLSADAVEHDYGEIDVLVGRHAGLPELDTRHLAESCSCLFDLIRSGDNDGQYNQPPADG